MISPQSPSIICQPNQEGYIEIDGYFKKNVLNQHNNGQFAIKIELNDVIVISLFCKRKYCLCRQPLTHAEVSSASVEAAACFRRA